MSNYLEVMVIVEGKTEQIFIERVLAPYLAQKMIFIYATQVSKPGQKGGDIRFSRVCQDIGNHLKQRPDTIVTTFIDYYGTKDWPGLSELLPHSTSMQIAERLNQASRQEINALFSAYRSDTRFIPFIAVHEFESLLFSDSNVLASALGINESLITAVLEECGEPEAINNSPQTAPSKRLNGWCANGKFAKTTQGITIAESTGIAKIREACPLFNYWLEQIEAARVPPATTVI
ncbi:TPA: DUF4276 family protein [Escherichia coli]|nr:DUF4276 family protein [Escherichia coli]